jgi:general secretion pathway protein L
MPTHFMSNDLGETELSQSIRRQVAHWSNWWGEQIVQLLPDSVRQMYSAEANNNLILFRDSQYITASQTTGQVELAPARPIEALSTSHPTLLLERQMVLVRERTLPVASMAQFQDIMRLQVPAETPFELSDVFEDSRITDVDFDSGSITVQQVILHQDAALRHHRALTARSVAISGLDILDDNGMPMGLNLLPETLRARPNQLSRGLNLFLLFATIALAGLAVWSVSGRQERNVLALEAQLAHVHEEARAVLDTQQYLNRQSGILEALNMLAADPAQFALLYQAITAALPEDTYLEALSFKDDRLSLIGLSASTEKLVEHLEAVPGVTSARLLSATAANSNTQQDRFRIELTVATPSGQSEETHG